jgi:hypothetical protein
MRTQPAHISPGCPWCNGEHNPDIQCRFEPESTRFQFMPPQPAAVIRRELIRDANGKVIAVRTLKN